MGENMKVTHFDVLPRLPKSLEPLREIAFNLWYSWNWEAVRIFIRMDPEYWEKTYQNPSLMLGHIPQERLEELAKDDSFVADMKHVHEQFKAYMDSSSWFEQAHPEFAGRKIAYFSTEYGIDVSLPIYSGGLGVLAGDHLKSASDLGLPLVAVGLLYREGYVQQYLTHDGWQQEAYPQNDWYNLPVTLVRNEKGEPIRSTIELGGEPVLFQIWKVQVGRVPLFLLDTEVPQNRPEFKAITKRLYVGERDMRLRQELLLGIGGMRALNAMGVAPAVCHMNEGHAAFMAVERIRQIMERRRLTRQEAWEAVWASTVFTTHTPVPAGNERFEPDLVRRYVGPYLNQLDLPWEEFVALGRENPNNLQEPFCLTVLALHHAAHCNAVSLLHGHTSRHLWHALWPELPVEEVPISSVTNGIHTRSWLSHDMTELLDRYLGPRFVEEPMDFSLWERVEMIPDAEIWRTHERRRERLVWFARKRLRQQLERRGAPPYVVAEAEQMLDPEALTICVARRFAEYKRHGLILKDPDRIAALLSQLDRPVQVIFAGKAHPADTSGKQVIKEIVHLIRHERFRNRMVFIEDYDINVARYMVQGADVWLNAPRPPLEASGTSGMKAAVNGALQLSTLDGWWCEGYSPEIGWTIGSGEVYDNPEEQDSVESGALYDILEREIVPMFYERGRDGLPRRWLRLMKRSMAQIGARFNAHRMASDYFRLYYQRSAEKYAEMAGDGEARAKDLAAWRSRLRQHWHEIQVESVESSSGRALTVGESLGVVARVRLGDLRPDEVQVQLYYGALDPAGEITDGVGVSMSPDDAGSDGAYTYRCTVECRRSGRRGFAVRVLPHHPALVHPYEPGRILWG